MLKNIMTIGGCGFIGTNFINKAIKDYNILNIDNLSIVSNRSNIKNKKNYKFKKLDICNFKDLKYQIEKFKPEFIINFAAETHVDNSIKNSDRFIKTNILGVHNILKIIQNNKEIKLIQISTDEVFGDIRSPKKFNLRSKYNPSSPYSASKAAGDHLIRSWIRTYNIKSIIINCSNNYGSYQNYEKLIPKTIINCINKKKIPVYKRGLQIRDWIFVDDHVNAILKILKKGIIGKTYLIGGDNEEKNINIIRYICKYFSDNIDKNYNFQNLIKFTSDRPGHDFRYAVDSSFIKKQLNWKPKNLFYRSLIETINWYLKNQKKH
jgi:dTDP-glucose 4,6-dehydratase